MATKKRAPTESPERAFYVTIKLIGEQTYRVTARSKAEARRKAANGENLDSSWSSFDVLGFATGPSGYKIEEIQ